jgi:hypothetical protein
MVRGANRRRDEVLRHRLSRLPPGFGLAAMSDGNLTYRDSEDPSRPRPCEKEVAASHWTIYCRCAGYRTTQTSDQLF